MTKPDWEAIESTYRAGSLSIRAIAEKHGVSDTAIRKRATIHNWQRDLTERVKHATKMKLVRTEVRNDGSQSKARTDAEIIEEASDATTELVLSHREGLAGWRKITNKLREFVEDTDITSENHASMARTIAAGVDAQIKVITAERKAYNLDTDEGNKVVDDLSNLMDSLSQGA
jgi:hypothetical protein